MHLERSTLRDVAQGVRAWIVGSPRWLLMRRMPASSLPLTIAVAVCITVNGILPTAFTLVFGGLIGALPAAVEQGPDSPARDQITFWLAVIGVIFVAQQMLVALTLMVAQV